jgi:hypothetical protein
MRLDNNMEDSLQRFTRRRPKLQGWPNSTHTLIFFPFTPCLHITSYLTPCPHSSPAWNTLTPRRRIADPQRAIRLARSVRVQTLAAKDICSLLYADEGGRVRVGNWGQRWCLDAGFRKGPLSAGSTKKFAFLWRSIVSVVRGTGLACCVPSDHVQRLSADLVRRVRHGQEISKLSAKLDKKLDRACQVGTGCPGGTRLCRDRPTAVLNTTGQIPAVHLFQDVAAHLQRPGRCRCWLCWTEIWQCKYRTSLFLSRRS